MLYVSDIDVFVIDKYTEYYDFSINEILIDKFEQLCNEIIDIRTSVNESSINPKSLYLISPYRTLAFVAGYRHEYDKACFYINKAIEECDKLGLKHEHSRINYIKSKIMKEQGNILFAIDYMRSALQIQIEYFEKYDSRTIYMTYELGNLYEQIGDIENAVIFYEKAIDHINRSHLCLRLHDKISEKIKSIKEK